VVRVGVIAIFDVFFDNFPMTKFAKEGGVI